MGSGALQNGISEVKKVNENLERLIKIEQNQTQTITQNFYPPEGNNTDGTVAKPVYKNLKNKYLYGPATAKATTNSN